MTKRVFIDGCAINRFALINVDPARALAATPFTLGMTRDLEAEYRRALDHLFVPSYVKRLIERVLAAAISCDGQGGGTSTDRHLLALAQADLVITDDAKLYRRADPASVGLIAWPDVEAHLRADGRLADFLAARAAIMPEGVRSGRA